MSEQNVPQGEGQSPEDQNPQAGAEQSPQPDDRPPQNRIREAQRKQEQAESRAAQLQDEIARMSQTMSQMMSRMNPDAQSQPRAPQLPDGFGQQPQEQHRVQYPQFPGQQGQQYQQQPQAPQAPQGQQNQQGIGGMREMLRQMVQEELTPLYQERQQDQLKRQIEESKNKVISAYGSVDTRPDFYDAVDREVSMRAANHRLAGTSPLPSIYEDAAAVVAQRWGPSAPTRQAPPGGGQPQSGTATPERAPDPESDADASGDSDVQLTELQKGFNERLRSMGIEVSDDEVAKHLESGRSGIDRLYSMAQHGKGRIGRSARSVGR